ncbi:LPS export ABC transporter permease LptF [Alteromonas sp. LMIT006]|jgi:lipopolysaccharide export system permease protein|uniref:LPS export ABC transporter permease LptF n=1 Tax=Alteromonadaceae TaxID=72275 RepID=UPI0020CA5845|nr:LPS export ABC transporter permease LptF [Alteromonas sp. LMIT006]UTP72732.1 LPS export ABC transporter permease LptF [Alteromonas sp. LMIT006]
MIIFRYLLKETLKSQVAIFLILMAIFITLRFVRVLGDATDGEIPANLVIGFLSLYSPVLASLILPISFFLGIMIAHGRLYVDSEMTVLRACGVSEWYVTRVTLFLSLLLGLVTASVTMVAAPLAVEQEYQLREQAGAKSGIAAIIPGRFQQTGSSDVVIFVHDVDTSENQLRKIFLSSVNTQTDETIQLVYAESGDIEVLSDGTQLLTLYNGQQTIGELGTKAYQSIAFDTYRIQVGERQPDQVRRKIAAAPTVTLLGNSEPAAVAEWQWRLAIPLSLPFLTLLAVPLSSVNPRQGRFGKLLPGILLYLGYFLLLMSARRALEDGKLPEQVGLWWVHGIILLIGFVLISRQRSTGVKVRKIIKGAK